MSKTVETTPVVETEETSKKKFNFSRKQIATAVAAIAGTAAVVVLAVKLKNDGLKEATAELVTEVTDAVKA